MFTTYIVWDRRNQAVAQFAGPCRLAKWDTLPDGWTIEEFLGDVSRGCVDLASVRRHAELIVDSAFGFYGA